MTVHHDKKAYGKLAKTEEELSDEQILKMIKRLNGEEEILHGSGKSDTGETAAEDGKKP